MDVFFQTFGWLVLATVVVAIPVSMVVYHERANRDVRRRLIEMSRLHGWQERCQRLDERGGLWVPPRKAPEAYRPSNRSRE